MSRTYRRKDIKDDVRWLLRDWVYTPGTSSLRINWIDPKSDEGLKLLNHYHSDKYKNFKEPGPAWYRNILTERPQRREAKRQLRKFLLDEEFVVILNSKDPLEYWT